MHHSEKHNEILDLQIAEYELKLNE